VPEVSTPVILNLFSTMPSLGNFLLVHVPVTLNTDAKFIEYKHIQSAQCRLITTDTTEQVIVRLEWR